MQWFQDKEIPNLVTDTIANEVTTDPESGVALPPLHNALMRNLGVVFTEIVWLEELAEACAADNRWSFLYVAAPLKVVSGTGAPVNPPSSFAESEAERGTSDMTVYDEKVWLGRYREQDLAPRTIEFDTALDMFAATAARTPGRRPDPLLRRIDHGGRARRAHRRVRGRHPGSGGVHPG